MTDRLQPGHEKPPARPLPVGPRPGRPHPVDDNENWASVAKKHGVTVRELIANNCGLNVTPEEINWYLHFRVGCNFSRDGKNWSFSKSAKPGILYVPPAGKIPVSSQNPDINTLYSGPKDLGCGGIEWLVEFKLPKKAEGDGWIIQQVDRSYDIRKRDGSVADANLNAAKARFWEAWPVRKGERLTSNRYSATADGRTYDDSFDQPTRANLKGTFKVIALVKFFEIAALPSDFIKQNPHTRAEDLHSTIVKPAFWDGTGTVHNLTTSWDCSGGPDPGTPQISWEVWEKKT
jgi:hypothetical protein